jgi:hypothetical protein
MVIVDSARFRQGGWCEKLWHQVRGEIGPEAVVRVHNDQRQLQNIDGRKDLELTLFIFITSYLSLLSIHAIV